MKDSNEPIGNRTRELPACSAVPQPSAPSPTPIPDKYSFKYSGLNPLNVSCVAANTSVDRMHWCFQHATVFIQMSIQLLPLYHFNGNPPVSTMQEAKDVPRTGLVALTKRVYPVFRGLRSLVYCGHLSKIRSGLRCVCRISAFSCLETEGSHDNHVVLIKTRHPIRTVGLCLLVFQYSVRFPNHSHVRILHDGCSELNCCPLRSDLRKDAKLISVSILMSNLPLRNSRNDCV